MFFWGVKTMIYFFRYILFGWLLKPMPKSIAKPRVSNLNDLSPSVDDFSSLVFEHAPVQEAEPDDLNQLLVSEIVVDRKGRPSGAFIRLRSGARQYFSERKRHSEVVLLESINRVLDSIQGQSRRVFLVELSAHSLKHAVMDKLADQRGVLLLRHGVVSPKELARIVDLRAKGLRLALWLPGNWPEDVMKQADGYVFSFEDRSPIEAVELITEVRRTTPDVAMIVVDIRWREEYDWCMRNGCHYAAGKLFHEAAWNDDGPLNAGVTRVLEALNKVRQDAEPLEIALSLKSDSLLTFRVLAQANAATNGFRRKVESIDVALAVVGRAPLYRSLVLLLYAMETNSIRGSVLHEMAIQRAELMVRFGEKYLPGEHENLYLTGLFSMLEQLMRRPLARILEDVDIAVSVREALLDRSGPYVPFLALAEAAEQNEPPSSDLLAACGVWLNDFNRHVGDVMVKLALNDDGNVQEKDSRSNSIKKAPQIMVSSCVSV